MANVALGTSATQILAANAAEEFVDAVLVQNLGPNAIYVDKTNAVTTGTGIQIPASASVIVTFPGGVNGGLYGIAATAAQVSPADTRFFTILAGS